MQINNVVNFLTEEDVRFCVYRMAKAQTECSEAMNARYVDGSVMAIMNKINSYRKSVRRIRNNLRFGTLCINGRLYILCREWMELCDKWDNVKDTYVRKESSAEVWDYADIKV